MLIGLQNPAHIIGSAWVKSAALPGYLPSASYPPHCGRNRGLMLTACLEGSARQAIAALFFQPKGDRREENCNCSRSFDRFGDCDRRWRRRSPAPAAGLSAGPRRQGTRGGEVLTGSLNAGFVPKAKRARRGK
jgi:hypothetical protein